MLTKQIPDEFLREIGLINVRWSSLEQVINLALITVLGKDIHEGRSHVLFTHMSFPQKMDIFNSLVAELSKPPASLQRFKEDVRPLLTRASKERNAIAHAVWNIDGARVMRSSVSAHGELKFMEVVVKLPDLQRVSKYLSEAELVLGAAVFGDVEQFRNEDNMKNFTE